MPEHQGKDILADVDRFWEWYQSPDFEEIMRKLCPNMNGKFLRDELLVSGDSAGGFLATHSWLSQPKLHIKAMYLQYPMLRAYTRHRVDPYRGVELEKKHFYGVADRIHGKMKEMEDNGTLKSRTDSIPPLGMDLAYTLSSATKEVMWNQKPATISHWRFRFQELDILERVEALVGTGITDTTITTLLEQVMQELPTPKSVSDLPMYQPHPPAKLEKPVYCPPIFIAHGKKDTQVPWEDTAWFVEHVRALFPDQARICPFYVPGEGHGFDYMVEHWRKERRWLGKMMMMIATDWLPTGSEKLSLEGKPPASNNGQNGITFDDLADDDIKEAKMGVAQILADFHSNYKQYEKTARAALQKELEDEIKAKEKANAQKS
jgi:acetyl esterase/lipase